MKLHNNGEILSPLRNLRPGATAQVALPPRSATALDKQTRCEDSDTLILFRSNRNGQKMRLASL